jgi:hypothetical protein
MPNMAAGGCDKSNIYKFHSFIRGFHVYQNIWSPEIGEEVTCTIEENNHHDKFAVCVLKNDVVVGHVPLENSRVCYFFLKRGGRIIANVTGHHRNRGVVIGLEIPAEYIFMGASKDVKNLSKLLNK